MQYSAAPRSHPATRRGDSASGRTLAFWSRVCGRRQRRTILYHQHRHSILEQGMHMGDESPCSFREFCLHLSQPCMARVPALHWLLGRHLHNFATINNRQDIESRHHRLQNDSPCSEGWPLRCRRHHQAKHFRFAFLWKSADATSMFPSPAIFDIPDRGHQRRQRLCRWFLKRAA